MKILLSGLVSVITLFTPLYAQTTADEEQVKNVIVDAFQALADLDMAKFRSYCQPDFMLLENGEIWTVDTLEARMKPRIGSGMKRINTVDFERVTVKGNVAWVTYNNQADIDAKGQKRTIKWLESAVLEKERRGWKMTLLHSTVLLRKN
ncbi:nuclear transport factor 2 family protein [Spirosoma arcticum]